MPIKREKSSYSTTYEYDVPIPDNIGRAQKREFMEKVGQFIVDSMLDKIAEGVSPVSGVGSLRKLTEEYAKEEKGGDRTPNLDEHGDMLDALTYKIVKNKIIIGIFDKKQAIKAYAHNTGFEGHPFLENAKLKRQFIPDDSKDEKFTKDIMQGIGDITDEYSS